MIHHGLLRIVSLLALVLVFAAAAAAQKSGDVFREFTWRTNPWQRAVGHDATASGAKVLLPNATNSLKISDLKDAVRAEIQIEKLTSHVGTEDPQVRFNDKSWLNIPWPSRAQIPGTQGAGGKPSLYMMFYYPRVSIPLSHLREGTNRFKMTCSAKNSSGFAKQWPQFIFYGVTVRVYYKSTKPHATGTIRSPNAGSVLGDNPTFRVRTSGSVAKVEYLGDYDHYNFRGDGTKGWQRSLYYGQLGNHIGTSTSSPFSVRWNTKWVPTQRRPFQVVARITDRSGMVYMTPPLTGLTLSRSKTVIRYKGQKLPMNWVTNYWQQKRGHETTIPTLSRAEEARLFLTTWNGYEATKIGVNSTRVARRVGKDHDISWDNLPVSLSALKTGTNELYTESNHQSHGIEVQWPGMEIFVRYDIPESVAQFAAYGTNCRTSKYSPTLAATGAPALGKVFGLRVSGAVPNAPFFLTWGGSNTNAIGIGALPFSLAGAGAPGYNLWASIDFSWIAATNSSGNATLPVYVPRDSNLVGRVFFHQALLPVPGANALQALVTNGGRTLVGR